MSQKIDTFCSFIFFFANFPQTIIDPDDLLRIGENETNADATNQANLIVIDTTTNKKRTDGSTYKK